MGVREAAAAANGAQRLAGADFWAAWAVTVGIYATLGLVVLGALGVLIGGAAGAVGRPKPASARVAYVAIAAMMVPAALLLGHADLDLPGTALWLIVLRVAGISIAVGIVAGMALRFVAPRLAPDWGDALALIAGCLAGGALWARWGRGGLTLGEGVGAVVIGVAVALGLRSARRWRRKAHPASRNACDWRWVIVGGPLAVVLVTALAVPRIAFPSGPRAAPNVLLITVDALRADHVGAYSRERSGDRGLNLTPSLDHFARDGVVFDKAFASAPWTAASLGSMSVSLYPSELGLVPAGRREREIHYEGGVFTLHPALAELLRQAGYTTVAEVPNPQIRRDRGLARGFLRFRNPYDFSGERAPALPRLGKYETWFLHTSLGLRAAQALHHEPTYYRAPGLHPDNAERVIRDSVSWIEQRPQPRPFFLWLHLMDLHVPYNPPEKSPATLAAFPRPPFNPTEQFYKDLVFHRTALNQRQKAYVKALYDDGVRYTDRWIGRLLGNLRRLKLYDRMLIIVTADHGEELWDHGGFEHGDSLYDEVLQVPLLIKFPGNQYAGHRVSALAGLIDVAPTVLQVTGLTIPRGMRGEPLRDLARAGSEASHERALFAEYTLYDRELKGLRTSRYKVIFHPDSHAFDVYDLRVDPGETRNLAGDPQVAAPERRLLAKLVRDSEQRTAWWARIGAKSGPLDERTRERLRSLGYTGQ